MNNKKYIIKLLTIFILLFLSFPTFAVSTSSETIKWPYYDGELSAKSAFVMDADSSIVLYTKNANEKLFPASLTKIMTAIVVLDKSNGNYDDLVTFSYNAVTRDIDQNSVTIGASAGDQLSVKDCLYSLLLPSANDAANALAEHFAGSINDFALLMNEKAENLGLTNTHFVNPSGLHDDNQYTTASDMAMILQCALSYPFFSQISSTVSYRHAPIRKYKNPENSNNQVLNTTSILVPGSGYYYNGITAGKTGHTSNAGYNLAASARKEGMNLITVVMGCTNDKIRYQETKLLFDYHFKNYKSLSIRNTDPRFLDSINTISIDDVELVNSLDITCNENAHITLPKDVDSSLVESKISFHVDDIYNKYAIGSISYYLYDKFIGKCTLMGINQTSDETIYTSHLNLSSPLKDSYDLDNQKDKLSENAEGYTLFYKNSNGNIVISRTLLTVFIVIITLLLIIAIILFIYYNILANANFPINKIKFKMRRRFRY